MIRDQEQLSAKLISEKTLPHIVVQPIQGYIGQHDTAQLKKCVMHIKGRWFF